MNLEINLFIALFVLFSKYNKFIKCQNSIQKPIKIQLFYFSNTILYLTRNNALNRLFYFLKYAQV